MKDQIFPTLSPAEPLTLQDRVNLIREIWHAWSMSGDAGATSWDVLEGIQAHVTDCLYFGSMHLDSIEMAESLTFKAFLLREGQMNF
jgi:hypothetical protein